MFPVEAVLPEGFQMTELGPLPKEWRIVRLGEVVERGILLMRNGFPEGRHNATGMGVPHLRPFNITNDGALDLSQIKFVAPPSDDDPHWLHPGDVIFNNTNSEELVGKTAFFNHDGRFVLSNHMTFLRVLEPGQIDPYWLARLLHLFWHLGMYRALCRRHVNQASISLERLKGVRIPLPPLPEQRAIAHVLRTVQRAKEATERVIGALKELKNSLMRYLFTYGPVPVTERERVPLQETEIGPLPAHWRVVRLGEVARMKQGKVLPTSSFTRYGYPVYGANGQIGWFSQYTHAEEEVLVTCRGATCGTINVSPPKSFITNNAMIVTPMQRDRLQKDYLALALQMADLSSCITGSGQPQITTGKLALIPIPLPSLDEQREIARMLQAVDAKIAAEQARRAALEALFKTLLHELMTARRRLPVEFIAQFSKGTGHG
jgi:type I restriction enzyme S subunit